MSNASLAALLRDIQSLDPLNSLATSIASTMTSGARPGPLLVAHLLLLHVARLVDGEPVDEAEFDQIRAVLRALADFLEHSVPSSLDQVGRCFAQWKAAPTMQ